jgi:LacI family transcriptional regulator
LFLFHSPEDEQRTMKRIIGNGMVDGLIVTADSHHVPFVPMLLEAEIPFVQIGRPEYSYLGQVSYVDADNQSGAYQATLHLIKLGCRRVAQIATAHNVAGTDRFAGYCRAVEDSGYEVNHDLIAYGDFSEASGYKAMQHLLPHHPDAVFIQSDAMAVGALKAIRDGGLQVPDDIAVVAFDDLPLAATSEPPLTTVQQPIRQTGKAAVETLIAILSSDRHPPRQIVLPVTLVIRSSCGAKPNA